MFAGPRTRDALAPSRPKDASRNWDSFPTGRGRRRSRDGPSSFILGGRWRKTSTKIPPGNTKNMANAVPHLPAGAVTLLPSTNGGRHFDAMDRPELSWSGDCGPKSLSDVQLGAHQLCWGPLLGDPDGFQALKSGHGTGVGGFKSWSALSWNPPWAPHIPPNDCSTKLGGRLTVAKIVTK